MTDVLSFDIETKNLSYEIGGWGNTLSIQSRMCNNMGWK